MKFRFYILFVLFTFLFLFYPGDSHLFHIFAYNRQLFAPSEKEKIKSINEVPYVVKPFYPQISGQGVYVVELASFTPVLERNARESFYPASTTKIISALVSYDLYKADQILTVKTASVDGQIMDLQQGEKMTVENLLYGIMVHSANDAAQTLADGVGEQKFVRLMNDKAKSLHMSSTQFRNPQGFDDDSQYTTPFDLALAARAFLSNSYLAKFVSTKEITISDTSFSIFHHLTNVNKLIGEVQGVGGLKTGTTEFAKENLVSFYQKNGHSYIIVLLKSEDRFEDTKNIIAWIDSNVAYITPSHR